MVLENLSKSWDNQVQQKVEETEQTERLWKQNIVKLTVT